MFQNFLLKQMLKKQMKGVPPEQQEQIFTMIEKNPDFFMKIANEVQEKVKAQEKVKSNVNKLSNLNFLILNANDEQISRLTNQKEFCSNIF